jgi:hypothetical protein
VTIPVTELQVFEVFVAVKIQVKVSWVVIPFCNMCSTKPTVESIAIQYQCFGGPCCLHLEDEVTTQYHNPENLSFNECIAYIKVSLNHWSKKLNLYCLGDIETALALMQDGDSNRSEYV